MAFDAHKNFAYSLVTTAPSPATSGTALTVRPGEGALFPAVPFNATVWPASVLPSVTNAEVVRVTGISGDTLTITRTQEGSAAVAIAAGYQVAATITAKTLQDVEAATAGTGGGGTGTPTVLTTTLLGTRNDFNPGTLGGTTILRCNNTGLLTLTGLTNNGGLPTDGQLVWIESVGSGNVELANDASGSTAAYRIKNLVTATITLAAGSGRALLVYDGPTARWRVLDHEQGEWLTVNFVPGDFTTSGGGSIVPGAALRWQYRLSGRTLELDLEMMFEIHDAAASAVLIKVPGGFSWAGTNTRNVVRVRNGATPGVYGFGYLTIQSSDPTHMQAYPAADATQWSISSANSSQITGQIRFEVQ